MQKSFLSQAQLFFGSNFSRRIVELLSDDDHIASMNRAMEKLAIPDASAQVCEVIVNQIREGN
jgi:UDP-N-acetylglucosamine:LPS N-acetylglucosamine transferase